MYSVIYSLVARKDLRTLESPIRERIVRKIRFYSQQKTINPFCKPLQGLMGKYRFRIGSYRVIFRLNSSGLIHILMILRIKHRKDIYDL